MRSEFHALIAHQSIDLVSVPGLSTSYPQPVPEGRRAVTAWHTPGLRGTMRAIEATIVTPGHQEKERCG